MNSTRLTTVIFTLFMAVLWFPAIQKIFTLKWEKPLMGDIPALEEVKFSWDNWISEKYQKYTTGNTNQSFGFRPYFVRLHNQILYSLFNRASARDIIVGKKNYLFEKKYIDSYLGKDFAGADGEPARRTACAHAAGLRDRLPNREKDTGYRIR